MLEAGIGAADEVFHLVALTIVISILAHSSTDVVVARAFDESAETPNWHGVLRRARRRAALPGPRAGRRVAAAEPAADGGAADDQARTK